MTPLHLAARSGDLSIVKMLIDKGISDINLLTDSGESSLYFAVRFGHIDTVKYLLSQPKINVCPSTSKSVLHSAFYNGNDQIIKLVYNHSSVDGNIKSSGVPLIHFVAKNGCIKHLQILLEDPNINVNAINNDGESALHVAVRANQPNTINFLLQSDRINPNCISKAGFTPLGLAIHLDNIESGKVLIQNVKTNLNILNLKFETPLFLAISNKKFEFAKLLIENPSTKINTYSNGASPLYWAVLLDQQEIVRLLLLRKDIEYNPVSSQKITPLLLAIHYNKVWAVEFFSYFPQIDFKMKVQHKCRTPLQLAQQYEFKDIEMIIQKRLQK
jgi:ankyrin repeat protein